MRCTLFDPIVAVVTETSKVVIQEIVSVCDTDCWFIVIDRKYSAYRLIKDHNQRPSSEAPEKLLENVKFVQSNKHSAIFLTLDGGLLAMGKDPLRTGILGLGPTEFYAKTPKSIFSEKTTSISVSDNYAVALTTQGDLLLWGTTKDNFFGNLL